MLNGLRRARQGGRSVAEAVPLPPVNDAMQAFLGPLLPVARALNVPVLDFDRYGLVRDADATSRRVVPVATGFLAQYLGLE